MYFDTKLTVTIDGTIIGEVHSVSTKYDAAHVGSSCKITVPLNGRIEYEDGTHDFLTAYNITAFNTGDSVLVTASYPNTGLPDCVIFTGYVFDFKLGTPITINCIDYLPLLGQNQNAINLNYKSVTLQNLIEGILKGTGITLLLPTVAIDLVDITFRLESPWGILEYLKKMLGLHISLSGTNLFVNVASFTLDSINYDTSRNLYDSELQQPDTVWQGYKVKAWFVKENGFKDSIEVGDGTGHLTEVYFYNVAGGTPAYLNLANEALLKCKQRHYAGTIKGFLYPDCKLFDRVVYNDVRYPSKNGDYVIHALEHEISDEGFNRTMKLAYLSPNLNAAV